jgi:hypothetical protein
MMGKEFGRFSINPEVHRCAERAHALRKEAIGGAFTGMAHAAQALGRALVHFGHRRKAEPGRAALP